MHSLEVVIETILDDRADGHLGAGPQLLHGLSHHVGRVMADEFERTGVLARHDFDGAVRDRIGKVAQLPVDGDGDSLLGE